MNKMQWLKILLVSLLLMLSSFFPVSFVWGSSHLFFSPFCVLGPVAGFWIGAGGFLGALLLLKLFGLLFWGVVPPLFSGIATFIAAWCWQLEQKNNFGVAPWICNVGIPVLCMMLFWIHPLVGIGWPYALFWMIPIVLFLTQKMFFDGYQTWFVALRSTFLAHAVGSVIWCYSKPMLAEQWIALMPIVVIERVLCAGAMVGLWYLIDVLAHIFFVPSKNKITIDECRGH